MNSTQDRTITVGNYCFDEKKHLHTLDGKPLTGVTTILKVIGKGDVLVNWAANCAVDFIQESSQSSQLEGYKEWIVNEAILKDARKAHTKKKEAAGDWGTSVHTEIERYILNQIICQPSGTIDKTEYKKEIQQFIDWAVTNKVKFLASEKHVHSRRLWIGGICDIICEIDGKRFIGDIKTSKGIYPEAFIQCSAYAECLKEMGEYQDIYDTSHDATSDRDIVEKAFDGVVIINLKKDGGFDVQYNYDLEGNLKCFEAAVTIYRHMDSITK